MKWRNWEDKLPFTCEIGQEMEKIADEIYRLQAGFKQALDLQTEAKIAYEDACAAYGHDLNQQESDQKIKLTEKKREIEISYSTRHEFANLKRAEGAVKEIERRLDNLRSLLSSKQTLVRAFEVEATVLRDYTPRHLVAKEPAF